MTSADERSWKTELTHLSLHNWIYPVLTVVGVFYLGEYVISRLPHKPPWLPEAVAHLLFHNALVYLVGGIGALMTFFGPRIFLGFTGVAVVVFSSLRACGISASMAAAYTLPVAVATSIELVLVASIVSASDGWLYSVQIEQFGDEEDAPSGLGALPDLPGLRAAFSRHHWELTAFCGAAFPVAAMIVTTAVAWLFARLSSWEAAVVGVWMFGALVTLSVIAIAISAPELLAIRRYYVERRVEGAEWLQRQSILRRVADAQAVEDKSNDRLSS